MLDENFLNECASTPLYRAWMHTRRRDAEQLCSRLNTGVQFENLLPGSPIACESSATPHP